MLTNHWFVCMQSDNDKKGRQRGGDGDGGRVGVGRGGVGADCASSMSQRPSVVQLFG